MTWLPNRGISMRRLMLVLVLGLLAAPQPEWAGGQAASVQAAEHAEHAPHIGEEGVSDSPVEFKSDLAIFTFIVFLLLLGILAKFAWGPISEGLEKREHHIAEQIAAAERANAEAKEMLAQYERKLASAQDEVRAIIDEARRDATHTQQEILAQARADAASEMDRAKREVETAKDQALRELAETSAKLAVELAGKIIRAQLDPNQHAQLISEALSRFPNPSAN
jgi:F-type H+-transporting ATPase subunit b